MHKQIYDSNTSDNEGSRLIHRHDIF